jgi:hypothetical protein
VPGMIFDPCHISSFSGPPPRPSWGFSLASVSCRSPLRIRAGRLHIRGCTHQLWKPMRSRQIRVRRYQNWKRVRSRQIRACIHKLCTHRRSHHRQTTRRRRARHRHRMPRRRRRAPYPARRPTERRQRWDQRQWKQGSSRHPVSLIRKGSGSFRITAKSGGDSGARYGDPMPTPGQIQAAAFTVPQT